MRSVVLASVVIVAGSLVACGDDGSPDRKIAFLRTSPIPSASQEAFLDELDEAGWRVGGGLTVLNDDPESVVTEEELAEAVVGLVADGADLVVALSTAAARAAIEADIDVPVLVVANDPVASGLIVDPRAPEGIVTGIAFRVPADRTIDLAQQLVGGDVPLGLLHAGDVAAVGPILDDMSEAATALGVHLVEESFDGEEDVPDAIARLSAAGVAAIILASSPLLVAAHDVIEEAITVAGLPAIANTNVNPFAVLVLAPDNLAVYRQLGRQAARLLGGADVDEVPLEDPGEFHLVIRAEIAAQLGLVLPDELVARADELSD